MNNDNINNRDIVLHYRDGGLQCISELHRSYDPLQYPLLFPYGKDGWYINLKLQNDKKLTALVHKLSLSYYGKIKCVHLT